MKTATKHPEALKSTLRKLVRKHPSTEKPKMDGLRALVRGAFSFDVADSKVDEAMKTIDREFVDLNELRVATELELQEMLGARYPKIEKRTALINRSLNEIFDREHTLNLERMKDISRRDIRAFLRELPDMHPFVDAYVMLFAFDGHTFPIDDETLEYLTDEGVFEEGVALDEAQKFIEHQLDAKQCYELYSALRQVLHAGGRKKRKAKN